MVGTGVGTETLPVNYLVIGKHIHMEASGFVTTGATPQNTTWRMKLQGVTIASVTFTPTANLTNGGWSASFDITCRTTGAGGTVFGEGKVFMQGSPVTASITAPMTSIATTTINTTTTALIDFTLQTAAADAAATYTSTINLTGTNN